MYDGSVSYFWKRYLELVPVLVVFLVVDFVGWVKRSVKRGVEDG